MPFLPPNQQRQSTEGKKGEHKKAQKENTCDIKNIVFLLSRKMSEISTVRSESVRLIENA